MYPTGSNGASQAIVDARVLGAAIVEHGVTAAALCVSALAFIVDGVLAASQRALTPAGLRGRTPSLEPDTSTRPAAV